MAPTMIDRLLHHAALTPDKVAYRFLLDGETESDVVTFAQLRDQVSAVAGLLIHSGLAHQRVVLSYPFGIAFIYAFLGCLMAGAIPMPMSLPRPNRPNGHLDHIIRSSEPAAGLTVADVITNTLSKMDEWSPLRQLHWIATDTALPTGFRIDTPPPIEPIALIQFSSGSTSAPKGVVITHDNIMANQAMIQHAFGHHRDTQGVGWLPMYHDMGLIGNVLQCVYVGYTMTFLSPISFIQKPIKWLRAISRYRGTSSGGPNFAYAHCVKRISEADCEGLDLGSWDLAFNGAEPIYASTIEAFVGQFSKFGFNQSAMFPCYGLAEGTLIVTGGRKGTGPSQFNCDTQRVGSGQSLMSHPLRIVNPDTQMVLPDGSVGEIWISGTSVAVGDWTNGHLDTAIFSLTLDGDPGRYFATGDLGTLMDGELVVTGRRKELMIIDGKNYYPHDIELTAQSVNADFSSYSTVVFSVPKGTSESVIVVQEVRRAPSADQVRQWTQLIRAALSLHHDLSLGEFVVVIVGTIEKTSSGKLKRLSCMQRYIEGSLPVLSLVMEGSTHV